MKAFLKEHRGLLIAAAAFLLFLGSWMLIWKHISDSLDHAEQEEAFTELVYDGAYYTACDESVVRLYVSDAGSIDKTLCGSQLGEMSIPTANGTVVCPLYACKPLEDAGKENAILLLERSSGIKPYELTGFPYLDSNQSIWAVCASYGIGAGSDLESVTVREADGRELAHFTEPDALDAFFVKFAALGENLSDTETAEIYRDTYIKEYGDDGSVTVEDGKAAAADDETYDRAMALWSEGVCKVDICLKNGLRLRDCIYAPRTGLFTVYGTYHFTEPFF